MNLRNTNQSKVKSLFQANPFNKTNLLFKINYCLRFMTISLILLRLTPLGK